MAFALLAVVPFLLALIPADDDGVFHALARAVPSGLAAASLVLVSALPLSVLGFTLWPISLILALLLGLVALPDGIRRAKDGSLALAILGIGPAASGVAVLLLDYLVGRFLGFPWGRMYASPRPMFVFAAAVAITVLISPAVALWMLKKRWAVPSKPEAGRDGEGFDRDSY